MRETYQPPTTSPAGPLHDHTTEETTLIPPSTKPDKIPRKLVCAHARARQPRSVPFSLAWIGLDV